MNVWSIALASLLGQVGDAPASPPTPAATLSKPVRIVPSPGGYFPGLTKPLVVDVSARIWGPGIATPPPGGEFLSTLKRRPAAPVRDPLSPADGDSR